MNYFVSCIKDKYACFSGRARRQEYWMFVLFNFLLNIVAQVIDGVLTAGFLSLILCLALLLPGLGVTVRRLHDTNRSGWWVLIAILPIVGAIVLLVFMCLDSTSGDNKFGPNPKAAA